MGDEPWVLDGWSAAPEVDGGEPKVDGGEPVLGGGKPVLGGEELWLKVGDLVLWEEDSVLLV